MRPTYLHEPNNPNKSYFDTLQNYDDEPEKSCGEGVLINGNPDRANTGNPVSHKENHKISELPYFNYT